MQVMHDSMVAVTARSVEDNPPHRPHHPPHVARTSGTRRVATAVAPSTGPRNSTPVGCSGRPRPARGEPRVAPRAKTPGSQRDSYVLAVKGRVDLSEHPHREAALGRVQGRVS
jgi:hypothetical protein